MFVIIPCHRRPAHLAALLRTIERAREADQHRYIFSVDFAPSPRIHEVIDSFTLRDRVALVMQHGNHGYHGPAYNILNAWGVALSMTRGRWQEPIGLLEEDLLVAEDIFEFWRDAFALVEDVRRQSTRAALMLAFGGVSACRNQNVDRPPALTEPECAVYLHRSYQSLAVALPRWIVEDVLEHATPAYFENPTAYVHRHLPDDGLPAGAVSQDALFHRVIRANNRQMLYPVVPRAYHAGWYGYNRRDGVKLDDRAWAADAERILAMTTDQLNELADPRFRDLEACPLIRPRVPLKLF